MESSDLPASLAQLLSRLGSPLYEFDLIKYGPEWCCQFGTPDGYIKMYASRHGHRDEFIDTYVYTSTSANYSGSITILEAEELLREKGAVSFWKIGIRARW